MDDVAHQTERQKGFMKVEDLQGLILENIVVDKADEKKGEKNGHPLISPSEISAMTKAYLNMASDQQVAELMHSVKDKFGGDDKALESSPRGKEFKDRMDTMSDERQERVSAIIEKSKQQDINASTERAPSGNNVEDNRSFGQRMMDGLGSVVEAVGNAMGILGSGAPGGPDGRNHGETTTDEAGKKVSERSFKDGKGNTYHVRTVDYAEPRDVRDHAPLDKQVLAEQARELLAQTGAKSDPSNIDHTHPGVCSPGAARTAQTQSRGTGGRE